MTFLKQISLLALAACLGLVLVGCQPSDPDSPNVKQLTSIAVTPNPVSLEIGGVQALTVTGTLSDNSTIVVTFGSTFVSSAPAIAKVDASTGYVTAVAAGNATITATHTASGKTATTAVTVSPLRVLSIAVTPATNTLTVGATQALTVTATYNNLTTGPVTSGSTFVSSNPAVATIGATGVVTAVALGSATITATHTASGKTGTAAVTVSATPIGGGFSDITFDTTGVTYELRGFGGAEDSTLQLDPTNATNTVARVNRSATAADFAGTVVSTGPNETVGKIPFSATNTRMTVRVYSPAAGIRVLLKVEDSTDVNRFAQTQAFTTVANAWETLTFDFANPAAGTPALNPSYNYDRLIIFFNFGVTGATAGAQTFYFDDVAFPTGGATAPTDAPTTVIPAGSVTIYSDAASVTGLDPFPDWGQNPPVTRSEVTIAGNKSLQYVWAGPGGLYQGIDWSSNPVDVSTKGKLHIDFWTPDLASVKVSIISAGKENAYTQALTTGGWNSVDIDLSNYTVPDKSAIIQIKLEPTAPGTLYVDNIYFWGTASGSCGTTAPTCAPTTVIPAGSVTIYSDAASVTGLDPFPDWGQNPPVTRSEVTIAGNKSLQYVWAGPGGLYQGIDWSANPVDVSTKGKLHIDFWTPDLASVKVSIISAGKENAYTQALTTGGWNSVDIDLSNYTVPDKSAIIQIKLEPTTPGTLYVDNIYFWGTTGGGGATAPTDAPTTVIPAGSVTIYSDAASVTGLDPFPDWGQNPPVTRSEVTIAGNKSLQYVWAGPGGLYQGIDWSSNPVDVSTKGKLHIDFWTPDLASVKVSIISAGKENAYTQALTTGGWNSVDIDLSNYTVPDKSAIIQIKLEPNAPGKLYVDNIYFWGTAGGGGGSGALVTFDEAPPPKLTDFGTNGAPPVVDLDPAGGTNKVLKVFKYALPAPGSEQWAGVTVSTGANDSIPAIPFTATAKTMTVRVYSPAIGVRVRLKVENASNPAISCETDAITTQAGAWETLTFNFANPGLSPPVGGGATAPLDLAQTYNKISIFSDFGIGNGGSAPLPADRVYYYDDITF